MSALLKRSTALAKSRTTHANQQRGKQHNPNIPKAEAAAAEALTLRLQAHALDPSHLDPEWGNDLIPHEQIVDFLTRYASIP